jgi:ribosomal protein S12 methylthiotransferase
LRSAVQGASAYLKIADGCRRPCAFCAIPLIKGTAVSRPPEAILAEARSLQAMGVRELNLIAQDTTDYGHDRSETARDHSNNWSPADEGNGSASTSGID